jgi:flagellin
MLVRLKELNVQKLNGTYDTDTDTVNLDLEITQLGLEIASIYENTKFNGKTVLSTTAITLAISENGLVKLAVKGGSLATITSASTVGVIEAAITDVNELRATFGSQQNRLESTVRNLKTTAENLQAAESRIRDTDMAEEMSNFTKNNILVQAGTAMLAQANQAPQNVLSLLR